MVLLNHLTTLGFAVVAVGNRDDGTSAEFQNSLSSVASIVLQRPNRGYDFGGYREGLLSLRSRLPINSTIMLLNNSMYGPFKSLQPIFQAMPPEIGDAWGMTSSLEIQPHVQSYFWLFHPAALHTHGFWHHCENLVPIDDWRQTLLQH